jgi:hypothetical protein
MDFSGGHCAIVAALLAALLAFGCAGVKQSATPAAPAATAPPPQPAALPPPLDQAAAKPAAKPAAPEAKAAAKPGATAAAPPAKAAPAPIAKAVAAPLDLKALETELKETKAIGVMTKLSIKNQVDDLLSQFRAFYQGKVKTTLAELRRPFDLLVLKLLSLLQDSDPTLAAAIVASREAIWGILSDRTKFASLNGG